MKILLISFNWVEYLVEMANALAARGHACDVILKTSRVRETVGDALPALLDPRVRAHLLDDRPRGLRDPRQWLTVPRFVALVRSIAPDVVNVHDTSITYLPFGLKARRRSPLLLTVHDVALHPGADEREPRRRAWVRRALREAADAVIVHGERLREQYLAEPGPICRNVHSIPHGCYTVLRHWLRPGVAEIPRSVLFFGRLHAYKGLDVLLQAMDRVARDVPDVRLIVAGDGEEMTRRHATLAADPRCIVERGYLGNDTVARVFQQAGIVVLPYIEGSQSGVVRIAYVFGKPVIVTRVGSIPESVKDGITGLVVPPRDPEALARAMVDLLLDDARRREMGAAAGRMASEDLSWSRIAERTEKVCTALLDQPARGADPAGDRAPYRR